MEKSRSGSGGTSSKGSKATPAKFAKARASAGDTTPSRKARKASSNTPSVESALTTKPPSPENGNDVVDQAFFTQAHQAVKDLKNDAFYENGEFVGRKVLDAWKLLTAWPHLDGYARKTDDAQTKEARCLYRKMKKILRPFFGDTYDEMLTHPLDEVGVLSLAHAQHEAAIIPPTEDATASTGSRGRRAAHARVLSKNPAGISRWVRTASASPTKTRAASSTRSPIKTTAGRVAKAVERSRSVSPIKRVTRVSGQFPVPVAPRARSTSPAKKSSPPRKSRLLQPLNVSRTRPKSSLKPEDGISGTDVDTLDDGDDSEPELLGPMQSWPYGKMADDDFGSGKLESAPRAQASGMSPPPEWTTVASTDSASDGDVMDVDSSTGSIEDPQYQPRSPEDIGPARSRSTASKASFVTRTYVASKPSAPGHGTVVSHTNPEVITIDNGQTKSLLRDPARSGSLA